MNELIDGLYDYWTTIVASLVSGFLLLKIKAHKDKEKSIDDRLDSLEKGHIIIDANVHNVKENQDIIRQDIQVIKEFILKNLGEKHD